MVFFLYFSTCFGIALVCYWMFKNEGTHMMGPTSGIFAMRNEIKIFRAEEIEHNQIEIRRQARLGKKMTMPPPASIPGLSPEEEAEFATFGQKKKMGAGAAPKKKST